MPRRPASRPRLPTTDGPAWPRRLAALVPLAVVAALVAWAVAPEGPARLRDRAEAAARGGDWSQALKLWREVNRTGLARGRTFLAEARACLALDRAAEAERALRLACAADPSDPEPWRLRLQLLRVEDRLTEALHLGWEAYAAVPPADRRAVLRDLTLALLADLPDDLARDTLNRWRGADPGDANAQVALFRRAASLPRSGDPDRAERVAALTALLDREPSQSAAREALVSDLADAGEIERGRRVLDAWPAADRDARYWRLRGRWDLDFDRRPASAVASLQTVLEELPHDVAAHYRLARALQAAGRPEDARRAAGSVPRLRETLDPARLGPRLAADVERLDPAACRDLASLCAQAGLDRLAEAWNGEAGKSSTDYTDSHR